ncbi:hypothetical protein CASFOL_041885 [Castilleja foliolosa]|uniref:Pectin acetylesterase n=1 Tax=Castilleja foliolosa TaxID=1961234 RepID=A0ABD3B9M7_9LAMI
MGDHNSKLLSILCLFALLNTRLVFSDVGHITFLDSAVSKGAVCLDGSPPAYSIEQGHGSGVNNWMIYLEGGGWCNTTSDCIGRSIGWLGSSYSRNNKTYYNGLLTGNQTYNPEFYNWNRVFLVYCDGASFSGDVEEVDPQTNLHYRGARIFNAIMEDLLAKGMSNAENVILSGSSAGGLATLFHCDNFRQQVVPNAKRVKCISDSGFFMHAKNLPGVKEREDYFTKIVDLHQMAKTIPTSCTSKMNPGLCLFPEYLVDDIQTPLFILESSFDYHQLREMITPYIGAGKPEWVNCMVENFNLTHCSSCQLKTMQEFQKTFINTLQNLKDKSSRGMFVHTCFLHAHIHTKEESICSSVSDNILKHKVNRLRRRLVIGISIGIIFNK